MSRPKKVVLEMSVLVALMGVTFYLLLRDRNITMVWASVMAAKKGYILLAVASMLLYIFCGGWCIRVLLHGLGQSMSIWRCFKYSFVEFYFSALTPSSTGGQPMQLVYMKQDGYSISDSSVILLAVTALYKLAFLMLALIFFLINWPMMAEKIFVMRYLFILGLVLNVALIFGLCCLLFSKRLVYFLSTTVLRLLGKLHLVKDAERHVFSLARKSVQYRRCTSFMKAHPVIVFRTFGVLVIQRLALLIIPYLIYRSFGLRGYGITQLLAVQLLLSMCVDMLPLPGAVGISEKAFLVLFGPIFGNHLLTSAVLLSRGISFYLMVLLSGIVISGIQLSTMFKKKKTQTPPNNLTNSGGTPK